MSDRALLESDAPLSRVYDGALLRRLLGYVRPYGRWAAAAVGLLALHSLLGVVGPLLTKVAIDYCLRPAEESTPRLGLTNWLPADRGEALLVLTALYLLVLLVSYFVRARQIQTMHFAGQRAMYDLRRDLFDHVQRLGLPTLDGGRSGRLVTRLTTDVDALNEMFTAGLVAGMGDILTLGFVLAVMLWLSPLLTLALLATAPFVALTAWLFRRRARRSYRSVRGAISKMQAFLQEHLAGMAVVQLNTHERESLQEFDELNEEHRAANVDAIRAHAWFYPTVELLGVIAVAGLLLLGGELVQSETLSLGVVVAFIQYGARIFRPLSDLSDKFNILQSAMAAAERIFGLLDTPPGEEPLPAIAATPQEEIPSIEFCNVWFAYRDEEWVLRDVSFRVEPGETLAVVGRTGAGKTTLIQLLLRFYEPQFGQILVGGREVREWPREDLRRQFGVVLQDAAVFGGTIESNIRLGGDRVSRDEALAAARSVGLDQLVETLSEGFDSSVGEGGARLSTGQKQLIGFARALAHEPRFLILDEATSAVDPESEQRIQEALERLVSGHTAIVIAHRLSTVRRADRILVLHKGRVRESGSHEELLRAQGFYWKLYQLQFEDQEQRSWRN